MKIPSGGAGGVSVHGELTELGDDDHPQYLLADGTRAMTGNLDLDGYSITNVNQLNGRSVVADSVLLDSIQQSLDGYVTSATFLTSVSDQNQINTSIFDSLDGYATSTTLLGYATVTSSSISTTVDYTNGITVAAGTRFSSQTDVDNFLNGTSGFKYLMDLWEALPTDIYHDVTITLTGEEHRPRAADTEIGWNLVGKRICATSASLTITGTGYTTIAAVQTITTSNNGTSGGNPSITVGGTPYAGLDLRGYYAELSTGQYALIHDNDSNNLYVCPSLSPAPTAGVSTVTVVKPATILKNTLTDLANSSLSRICVYLSFSAVPNINVSLADLFFTFINLTNITIDPYGPNASTLSYDIYVRNSISMTWSNVLIDEANYYSVIGGTVDRQSCVDAEMTSKGDSITVKGFSIRSPAKANEDIHYLLLMSNGGFVVRTGWGAFFSGGDGALQITGANTTFTCPQTVFEGLGDTTTGSTSNNGLVQILNRARFSPGTTTTGVFTQVRDCVKPAANTTMAAVQLGEGARMASNGLLYFSNCALDCVRVDVYAGIRAYPTGGATKMLLANGSVANTGYGIRIVGPFADVDVRSTTDVSGTNGQVLLGDQILSWATVSTDNPSIDLDAMNRVSR